MRRRGARVCRHSGIHRFALVGHSLGGVVITETARKNPDRIAALIYVGALVPAPGTNAAAIIFGNDLPVSEPRTTTEERAKSFFGNDMSDDQWTAVWQQFVPESPHLWNARSRGSPDGVPMTYARLTNDVGLPPMLARRMIANLGRQVDHVALPAGHIAMVTQPRELANAINDAIDS